MTDPTPDVPTAWKAIPGYEGQYEASPDGEVRSLPRPRTRGGVLHASADPKGYKKVGLAGATKAVHSLIALTFFGPRPAGLVVRHLNGDPADNRLENLSYGTPSQNEMDKIAHVGNPCLNRTHCPQGHPYDAANTTIWVSETGRPERRCRACNRAAKRARRVRNATLRAALAEVTP